MQTPQVSFGKKYNNDAIDTQLQMKMFSFGGENKASLEKKTVSKKKAVLKVRKEKKE
jgi:hypothetical protein